MLGRNCNPKSTNNLRARDQMCSVSGGVASGYRTGVSLLELTTVVLIIGILSAVAVPNISRAINEQRVHSAANQLAADMEYAKSQAKTLGRTVSISFLVDRAGYAIDVAASNGGGPYTAHLADVTLTASLSGSASTLDFDAYGTPASKATATISSGSYSASVTVTESGAPPIILYSST
ncbi:MAG TPA: hypothetical protein DDW52_29220 [Planctomycetaceae bacterium]|nr:hypothetical protein [Planctomycetaceae bacterium]